MLTAAQLRALKASQAAPNRLRTAMQIAGLTQVQLAERAGLTQPTISKVLNGEATPTLDTAQRLAVAFGCSTDDLFPSKEAVA